MDILYWSWLSFRVTDQVSAWLKKIASRISISFTHNRPRGRNNGRSTDMTGQILLHALPEFSFFKEWSGHFSSLNNCKRVRLRYLERVRRSENDISTPLPFAFDIPITSLSSFPTPSITCLLSDIELSVYWQNLMVVYELTLSDCYLLLVTLIRVFVYANHFYDKFVIRCIMAH